MAGRNELHKKYINVFVEIDVILGLYDLKSHIKYTHNTHSQTLGARREPPRKRPLRNPKPVFERKASRGRQT